MKTNYFTISEDGKRPYNEDSFYTDQESGLFLVCDGVGGSNKGEVASSKACEYFSEYLSATSDFSLTGIEKTLIQCESKFDEYTMQNPDAKGMATTLTLLKLFSGKAVIGHIGDSRVYHVRNGEILFQTNDHSFVNELVASGFLTPEEALTHPKRNQITRAIQGSENNTYIDVNEIDSVETNDYFMLCSDGILEGIDDGFIQNNFLENNSIENLQELILNNCREKSSDNFTAIVIKISQ
ncbi:PP2C family protein-serine/threonine phosphatase [Moheibacter sediminis]|uniref:Protein phosphatase n=1 Tax=Moheibacter sediminis TaxID=1434700 RepID=A0A1W2B5I9_9FLAO|nr:protein phosphatase 2C domain-containing protein [Moheibacter sediminis]SMC67942.1 protein phosphatase [Moheibacter sediminis]